MIETKEKTIDGCLYSVSQLPARRALKLKAKLLKLFGSALAQIFLTQSSPEEEKLDSPKLNISEVDRYKIDQMRGDSLVKGIQFLCASLDEKTFDDLCMEILQGVRKDGVELVAGKVDLDFAGSLSSLYKVIFFVLEVNFSDFFVNGSIGSLSQAFNLPKQEETTKKTYTFS